MTRTVKNPFLIFYIKEIYFGCQQKIAIGQLEIYLCLCALSLTIDIVSDKDKSKLKDAILIWLTKAKLLINKAQGDTQ